MKKLLGIVGVTAMVLLLSQLHAAESEAPQEGLISITLDDVELADVVRMFSRISGMSLVCNPRDLGETERVSVNLRDEPWRPALQAILAKQGLVLLPAPGGRNIYSITRAAKADAAVRIQYATAAISMADAVLADIRSNNVAVATARLQAFAESNRQTLKALETPEKPAAKEAASR